jgi:hypothetical protein
MGRKQVKTDTRKPMKTLSILLAVATTLVVRADEPLRTDINPALLYYQAFLVKPDLSQADRDYLFTNEWWGASLPRRFGQLIADYDNQFALLRQAAHATVPCDWGIDLSRGPATLLPHLAQSKSIAITTRLRVPWLLRHGQHAQAREELAAAFVMARNIARDGTLVSTLVQLANEAIDCSTLAENFGRFSEADLTQFLDEINAAPARRTVADCVTTEKVDFHGWLLRRLLDLQQATPGDDAQVMAKAHALLASVFEAPLNVSDSPEWAHWWERVSQAAGGTSQGLVQLVRDLDAFDPRLTALLESSYAEYGRQSAQFETEMRQTANPLVPMVFSAWMRARPRELRVLSYLAMARAAIDYKLHGEAGLKRVTDPCSDRPFTFQRFLFKGVDRGFKLSSAYNMNGNKAELIFVETEGPPFQVNSNYPGRPLLQTAPKQ